MQRAKVRNFFVQGLLATAVGAVIGTAALLVWMAIFAEFFDDGPWDGPSFMIPLLLPLVLPVAVPIAISFAILPIYLLGASLNYLLKRQRVAWPAVRVAIGSVTGGGVGALLFSRGEDGAVVGLIFGAAMGGAWFAVERVVPQALRKPGPWG